MKNFNLLKPDILKRGIMMVILWSFVGFSVKAQTPKWYWESIGVTVGEYQAMVADNAGNVYLFTRYLAQGEILGVKFNSQGTIQWITHHIDAQDANVAGALINSEGRLFLAMDSQTSTLGTQTAAVIEINPADGTIVVASQYEHTDTQHVVSDFVLQANGTDLMVVAEDVILKIDATDLSIQLQWQSGTDPALPLSTTDIKTALNEQDVTSTLAKTGFENTAANMPFYTGSPLANTQPPTDATNYSFPAETSFTFGVTNGGTGSGYTPIPAMSSSTTPWTGASGVIFRSAVETSEGLFVYFTETLNSNIQQGIVKMSKTDIYTVEWSNYWIQDNSNSGKVLADVNSNVYLYSWDALFYFQDTNLDVLANKFDKTGTNLWSKTYGAAQGGGNEVIWRSSAVQIDQTNGEIVMALYTDSYNGNTPASLLLSTNLDGVIQNYSILAPAGGTMTPAATALDGQGNAYFAGRSNGGGPMSVAKVNTATLFLNPQFVSATKDSDTQITVTLSAIVATNGGNPTDFTVVDGIGTNFAVSAQVDGTGGDTDIVLTVADLSTAVGDLKVTYTNNNNEITRVSNGLAMLTDNTGVSIDTDTSAPTMSSGTGDSNTQLTITFSEKVQTNGANPTDFTVKDANSASYTVSAQTDGTEKDNDIVLTVADFSGATGPLTVTYTNNNNEISDFGGNALATDATGVDVTLNEAPTLTSFSDAVELTLEDNEVEITFNELAAFGDEADTDGTVVGFRVTAVEAGTLKIGADAGSATDYNSSTNNLINASNNAYYTPGSNANGTDVSAISVKAVDDTGGASATAITAKVDITAVNDAPNFTKGADETINEDAGAQTVSGWATTINTDPADESGQTVTFSVSNDNNSLFSVQPDVDEASGDLTYTPAGNANGSATVTISLSDDGGTDNGGVNTSADQTFTITVNAVNDEPSFTKGSNQSLFKNLGAQTISGWATDLFKGPDDESGQTLTFTVVNNNNGLFSAQPAIDASGNLSFTTATDATGVATVSVVLEDDGGTSDGGDDTYATQQFTITVIDINTAPVFTIGADETVNEDAGAQTVSAWATGIDDGEGGNQTLTFSISNDNNALFSVQPDVDETTGDLTYTSAENAHGSATVTISLSDDGGTDNGGVDTSADQTFTITINSSNDAPSFTKGADETVLEDAGAQTVSSWASGLSTGPTDESGQTLSFNVSNDNNGLFSSQPSIDASGNLTYTPADNANGSATVTVSISDDGGTDNGGVDTSADQTFTISVTTVNDIPSFTKGSDDDGLEDEGAITLSSWVIASSTGPDNESGQTLSYNVTNDNNSLFSVQPAVDASGNLTYTTAENANGSTTVTISISDDGGSDNGGVDTSADQTFTIALTAVNDVPSFTKGADETVLEDAGAQTISAWATGLSTGPSDESGQTLSFNISNDNNDLFAAQPAIDASGNLTYTTADNANGSATVTVSISDDGGTDNGGVDTSADQTFTISVTAVNDIPSFTKGTDDDGLEDEGAITLSSWVLASSTGPDNESSQTLSYNVTNDNNSLFSVQPAVDASGNLTYTTAENANGSATVTISISDDGGTDNGGVNTSADQTFTIALTAVNDVPAFTKGADETVLEDAGAQTVSAWATDLSKGPSDENGQVLSFNVSNDNNDLFAAQPAIDASGNLSYTPADNANGSATVTVSISDDGGTSNAGVDTSADQTFTISVTAVNDVPSFTKGSDDDGLEDEGAITLNSWVVDFSAGPDDESGQTLSYNVSNDNNSLFSVQPAVDASGNLTYTTAENANGSATVTISISDDGGTDNGGVNTSADQTFTIALTAVNDVPSFTKGADETVLEDAGVQTVSGWATGLSTGPTDESGQALSFNVSNDNNDLFAVQPAIDASGNLSYTPADNANGSATVTVSISDDGGTSNAGVDTSDDQTFSITITPVNDVPSFTKGADESVLEDSGEHTVNGWATSISSGPSNEAGQTVSFNVSNDNNNFFSTQPAIDENGNLTYTLAAEAYGDATITVSISDDGGTTDGGVDTSADEQFVISIAPINDVPSFTKGADQNILEDISTNLETGRANEAVTVAGWATDLNTGAAFEEGESLTFNVSNDNNGLFAVQPTVNGESGDLMYTLANNANGTTTVTLSISDDGGTDNGGIDTSEDQTFTINVVAVNDAPTFNSSDDQVVNEDAGTQSVSSWARNISAGADDESGQILTFNLLSNTNPDLFEVQPAIDGVTGDLTYTPKADANGETSLIITLGDDGGTDNGGEDTSVRKFLTIVVNPVNDVPSFTIGGNQETDEDSGFQTINAWATNISSGPENENDQILSFDAENDNNGLFESQPAIDNTGTLTYMPALNAHGSATVTVAITDNGGTANGGIAVSESQTFMITVNSVNDIPEFTSMPDVIASEDQLYSHNVVTIDQDPDANLTLTATTIPAWLTFTDNGNGRGVLAGTPGNDEVGMHEVTIELSDGIISEAITQTFQIEVNNTNDAPTIDSSIPSSIDYCPESGTTVIDISEFASDIDAGDVLNYFETSTPIEGVTVDLTGSILTVTHAATTSGSFDIAIIVRDQGTLTAETTISVSVNYFELITKADGNDLRAQSDGNFQWFKDGTAISGATGSEFHATEVGTYKVSATNGNCVLESEDFVIDALTDINLENISDEVLIYPNPASSFINITSNHKIGDNVIIRIFDVNGKAVMSKQLNSNRLDISGLAKGVYVLQLLSDKNNSSIMRRIVKQ